MYPFYEKYPFSIIKYSRYADYSTLRHGALGTLRYIRYGRYGYNGTLDFTYKFIRIAWPLVLNFVL